MGKLPLGSPFSLLTLTIITKFKTEVVGLNFGTVVSREIHLTIKTGSLRRGERQPVSIISVHFMDITGVE